MQPSDAELRATIRRMEERLGGHPLFLHYERLAERFAADLPDERDVLLSRAAVLMLLQETASDAERSRGE
jgi:hypothetical protein